MDNNKYKKRHALLSILALSLATLFYNSADAAERRKERPLQKVTLAYSSISGTMGPVWVTYEAGFFRKHGLDVQLVFIKGGSKAVKALVSGDVDVAQVGGAGVLRSNLKGSDAVMIAGFLNTMNYEFIVDRNITRPEQLKGKAVAVSRFGGSSDFATRYALDKFGLVPEKDVAILEIGTQSDRLAALQDGKVQGAMLSVPHTLQAKKLGFSTLVSLYTLGLDYQHTGLATTKALIVSQPELLRRVMRAYVEGIHFYKTHRREALAILQKYLKTDDIEALDETYNVLALTLLPEKPYPTLRGIRIMLQRLAKKYPKAQTAKPERFVDLTFVMELDRSGFIDRLYKQTVATREKQQPIPAPARVKQKPTPAPVMAKGVPLPPSMPEPKP
ncbi:MAG: ABC transporter substrate-binding protein, partial [Candidatus Binatia bacterium]